tara:strand:+ start:2425 stop:2580 length:156 start_codon:yes stop_codon:yes gene_type:complete
MVSQSAFDNLEHRVDAIEQVLVEIQTMGKILRVLAIVLAAGVGVDISPYMV